MGTVAARRVTATIPIVQTVGSDLVAEGFARSLARPGGNVTGSTFFNSELMAKRLEVLKEILPSMTRAGVLVVRNHPSTRGMLEAMASAAQALNVAIQPIEVGEPGEFDNALSAWVAPQAGAIEHLGANAKAFGKKFDLQVHALAEKGLSIRAIARVLKVSHTTVLKRSKRRHKGKPHR